MFRSAELGRKIDKETWNHEVPILREQLLEAQLELLRQSRVQVVILMGGMDGAGRGETTNILNEWMDPRHIHTHGMGDPSDEERERPPMWRFWRALAPRGRIVIFLGSWYTHNILDSVYGHQTEAELEQALHRISRFERMLADENTLILKFWFHLSKDRQKKRLKALEKDPATAWRVTERDWEHFRLYDRFREVSERIIRQTSTAQAPWLIVEGTDWRYRSLVVGKAVLEGLRRRIETPDPTLEISAPPLLPSIDSMDILNRLELDHELSKDDYKSQLAELQSRLALLSRDPLFREISVVAVFEGNDAAGKGGSIRRVTQALEARLYKIIPVGAPTDEERAQPYLWRFWRNLPRRGRFAIFDRSWYGRVLVERVEGFCSEPDWMRAYSEINDFEEAMSDHDVVVVKFWLAISKEEQLLRFKERENIPFKRFKITDEDWRNREKWDLYERAVCDMVERTSTDIAPWTLVEANNKHYARLKVLRTLCEAVEDKYKELRRRRKEGKG